MGGSSNKPPTKSAGPGPAAPASDPCDLEFETDLVGVDPDALASVKKGDVLEVLLKSSGSIKSVVCATKAGIVVGSLAALRGLAQLIKCLEGGESFEATVQSLSRTNCHVLVQRS